MAMEVIDPSLVTFKDALNIAIEAHSEQPRIGGESYIEHVKRVAAEVIRATTGHPCFEHASQVAILHDVLEDSELTAADLLARGIPIVVVDAVEAISRTKCLRCGGLGRVRDDEVWNGARTRFASEYPNQFSEAFIQNLLGAALGDLGMQHCSLCGGGGWGDSYDTYLARVAGNRLATTVKRYDAWDNFLDDGRPGMKAKYHRVLRSLRDVPGAMGETMVPLRSKSRDRIATVVSHENCPWQDECEIKLVNEKHNIRCSVHRVEL